MITQDRLKELLEYDSNTGAFVWNKTNSNRAKKGSAAGYKDYCGYTAIKVENKQMKAHRLAWLYVYGVMPTYSIDHINGIRSDNRIENLRDVPHAANCENKRVAAKTNKIGLLGVCRKYTKWVAQIKHNKKKITIGYYKTPEEAHEAYLAKKRELHAFNTL